MQQEKVRKNNYKGTVWSVPQSIAKYLEAKFVVEEVDKVLDAGQDAMIQVLPCDALENYAEGWSLQVVVEAEEELVPMDCSLKHQQTQNHQVVLNQKS